MNTMETIEHLKKIIDTLPESQGSFNVKELNDRFSEYKIILDNVYHCDIAYLKRNTVRLYMGLSDLNKAIYNAEYGKTEKLRNTGFSDAVKGLRSDIVALKEMLFSFNQAMSTIDFAF